MMIRSKWTYVCWAAILFCLQPLTLASAHSFGSVGYSEIRIQDSSINYVLMLDHDQLLTYLPIDANGDGKVDQAEFSQNELIKNFILDHMSVIGNGKRGKPELLAATEVERNDVAMVRFDLRYRFDQPVKDYEIHYNFYFDGFDTGHKNFATVKTGTENKEKIFAAGDTLLKGTVESPVIKKDSFPKLIFSILTLVVIVSGSLLFGFKRRKMGKPRKLKKQISG